MLVQSIQLSAMLDYSLSYSLLLVNSGWLCVFLRNVLFLGCINLPSIAWISFAEARRLNKKSTKGNGNRNAHSIQNKRIQAENEQKLNPIWKWNLQYEVAVACGCWLGIIFSKFQIKRPSWNKERFEENKLKLP